MDQELLMHPRLRIPAACRLIYACLALAIFLFTPVASADAVVKLCQSDAQKGAPGLVNLTDALARGGRITFDCGPRVTISMTTTHIVRASVQLDGGSAERVTLDGGGKPFTMFRVTAPNVSLELTRLTVTRAVTPGLLTRLSTHLSGAVVDLVGGRSARLILDSVEIRDSTSPIYVHGGRLSVTHSVFQGNTGEAIGSNGTNDIADSTFISNETGLSIAGFAADAHFETTLGGVVTFANHRASAVRVGIGGRLSATGTRFVNNTAPAGAALRIDGLASAVTLRKTVYEQNVAQGGGGAISIHRHVHFAATAGAKLTAGPAAVSLSNASFRNNRALSGVGGAIDADLFDGGTLALSGARFLGNSATVEGGAVAVRPGGAFSMSSSLLKGNAAPRGAALMLVRASRGSRVSNTLVVLNQAQPNGGAVVANEVDFFNVTIADNDGSGLSDGNGSRAMRDVVTGAARVHFHNTVLADNRPGNCTGSLNADGNGASLQSPSPARCPGVELSSAAMLDTFYAPLPGSPALGRGRLVDCMAAPVAGYDVVAQKRGVGGFCSMGAFEAAPTRRAEELVRANPPSNQDSQHAP